MIMKDMNRRDFMKIVGGTTATTGLAACSPKRTIDAGPAPTNQGPVPTDKMTYRTFPGFVDEKISILGYGCMRFADIENVPHEGKNPLNQDAVNKLIDYAMEHGVNYYDVAPVYSQGYAERATGNALKRHPRDKFYVATKLSNFSDPSREVAMMLYNNSFKNLQVDVIDFYLLHMIGGGGMEQFNKRFIENGMIEFLKKEQERGKIRHLGFSFHGDIACFDYALKMHDNKEVKWDFVQIQMNFVDWKHASGFNTPAEYLYGELEKRGIPVVIMEPLLGGRLSNVPQHIVSRLKQRDPGSSVASWSFRYAGSFPKIMTVLSGMVYMEHLQDNIRTYSSLKELTDEEKQFLYDTADLMSQYPTIPCNDCKYCMPCPYGLDIPAIFVHYNKCVNEGNVPKSQEDPNYAEARRAFLIGYDRSVPKLRQAAHCTSCNQCTPHCPQNIRIPQEMQRIDKFIENLKQNTL
ncbi:MAG: aldo/keto reductase [Phocaeicola sp.]|uniref:aldo/keto reductase n=1 Tax=Phocaeicola sp. TaxID=2773926 RepID=UPI003F9EEC39